MRNLLRWLCPHQCPAGRCHSAGGGGYGSRPDGLEDGFTRMPSSQMWRRLWRPWESSAAEPFGRTSQNQFLSGLRGKIGE